MRVGEIMMAHIGKVFMNGRSQAIRLPKEFRFDTDEVYIRKIGKELIISAVEPSWDEFFNAPSAFGDDFMDDRGDSPAQEREPF